jgi:hypothetical protein
MLKKAICLLAICSAVQANQLNDLVDTSNAIVTQLDKGIMMVGSAQNYAHTGGGLSDGTAHMGVQISQSMLEQYNNALTNMSSYQPFGSVQNVLEEMAQNELDLMHDAVDTFTEVVVEMAQVTQVAEMAENASTPQEEADVQTFVAENQEVLTISQDSVDTYNQSVEDIETHANNASAFIAVASNTDAVDFLQQGAENNNTTAEQATVTFSQNNQWVIMSWASTNNATAVYLNGSDNFGIDIYMTDADILAAGSETEFYQTSPVALGYQCFMFGECSEY